MNFEDFMSTIEYFWMLQKIMYFFHKFFFVEKNILKNTINLKTNIRVKTHYIVHKILSQDFFCKILEFVIDHVIKYNQLKWKITQHYNATYIIITLYEFHG
jgi:hypothetical protein